jgi:DNA-binding LytR/AlgR family response regulator
MNQSHITPNHLFLLEGTTYTKIPLSEIDFIQADGNYAYLQAMGKRFAVKRSLTAIAEELDSEYFVRASRGILINFSRVNTVSFANGTIQLANHTLKMGKAYHAEIKNRMPRL